MAKKHKSSTEFFRSAGQPQRLQRVLAAAGVGSRRECEQFILDGRVEVDGVIVTQLGTKVDPSKQKVRVDGVRLTQPQLQYYMLNKPPGVVSTASDPSGRVRVVDLIKTDSRVYNVGRLDQSSEGLILVTNDGDLANQLTHPRFGVEKKYLAFVVGCPDRDKLLQITQGIYLAEAKVRVANVRVKKRTKDGTWLEIILDEGRNREIRRILARIGHKVVRLKRVAIGPLNMGDLPLGMHRKLTPEEVQRLKRAAKKKVSGTKSVTRRNSKPRASGVDSLDSSKSADFFPARKKSRKKQSRKASKRRPTKNQKDVVTTGRAGARAAKSTRQTKQPFGHKKKSRTKKSSRSRSQ